MSGRAAHFHPRAVGRLAAAAALRVFGKKNKINFSPVDELEDGERSGEIYARRDPLCRCVSPVAVESGYNIASYFFEVPEFLSNPVGTTTNRFLQTTRI